MRCDRRPSNTASYLLARWKLVAAWVFARAQCVSAQEGNLASFERRGAKRRGHSNGNPMPFQMLMQIGNFEASGIRIAPFFHHAGWEARLPVEAVTGFAIGKATHILASSIRRRIESVELKQDHELGLRSRLSRAISSDDATGNEAQYTNLDDIEGPISIMSRHGNQPTGKQGGEIGAIHFYINSEPENRSLKEALHRSCDRRPLRKTTGRNVDERLPLEWPMPSPPCSNRSTLTGYIQG
ncbi:hypothetical protein SODALDRAFT_374318 [Sodiomyces alkalinus F11]|uniref:Uncharacterized protein n=1 Tax=Sodiomyces alkalinus (strain CBS 110278 / VKM F-3762 / F11) TaxID=1314773 RepID=A0A3N2Q5E5_SODAK|nr:hypothetical protein SODALDRAFT_374318 [Sodiomyces alkalinus F11]ROT41917.1 hypothetical protein SODALDRAFT_374318 [Sodiomyces alkalinus F11]